MAVDAWLPSNQEEERLKRRRCIFPIWFSMAESRTISWHDEVGNLVGTRRVGSNPPIEPIFRPTEATTSPNLAPA